MARRGVNKVILIGNVGADPELRYTPGGTAVTNFNMATNESWADKSGERQEQTEWHRIVVWGRLAEICNQYLRKGSKVYIEGRLQTRSWEGQDGQKRYTTEVVARDMQMLDSRDGMGGSDEMPPAFTPDQKSANSSGGPSQQAPAQSQPSTSGAPEPPSYGADDDLPF